MHIVSHRTVAQVRLARVIPSMHVHLCVVLWLFSSPVSFSSSFRCSSSGPSRCLPPSSTRSSSPKACATSAWGPWPLQTTRHPSHPERGPPPTAVAEERWKLFNLIEEGLTRSDAVASMLKEQRVPRPGFSVGTSCLHVPSHPVFRCCNGPDQEFFFVDQEHYVMRPEFIACGQLRHTGSEGRRGGFPHRAVEAWHVQRRRALRSGSFDNILPGSAQFQGGRGHLEALVSWRRCCWSKVCLLCQETFTLW